MQVDVIASLSAVLIVNDAYIASAVGRLRESYEERAVVVLSRGAR